jgi:hypothetical protein
MSHPTFEDARRLVDWRPPFGVLSVYLHLQPGDRGGAWRTELRNGLAAVLGRADGLDHDGRAALRATTARIEERFVIRERRHPRGEVGFVEIAATLCRESWWSTHLAPASADTVSLSPAPHVAPLLCLVERGAPRGVALLSSERVRLLEWVPGHVEELKSWELSIFSRDWRERKAQRVPDPARSQAISAAGHDQFDERLAENRRRFLAECGRLAAGIAGERSWPRLLCFGAAEHVRDFRHGVPSPLEIEVGDAADLISEPAGRLEAPLAAAVERLDAERQWAIAERVLEEARGGMRGVAGPGETLAALNEDRVDRLVLDAALAGAATPAMDEEGNSISAEALIGQALRSGAAVSAVHGAAAELLAPVEGVAALLRY